MLLLADSCRQESSETSVAPTASRTLTEPLNLANGLILPVGTRVHTETAGLSFKLPANHYLLGKVTGTTPDKAAQMLDEATVTCTCNSKTGGCSPFEGHGPGGKTYGCATSDCSSCLMTVSARILGPVLVEGLPVHTVELTDVEMVDFTVEPGTVTTRVEASALLTPSPLFLQNALVQKKLTAFLEYAAGGDNAEQARTANTPAKMPENFNMCPINVFGRLVYTPINHQRILSAQGMLNEVVLDLFPGSKGKSINKELPPEEYEAATYRCNCNSGNTGCKLQSKSIGIASVYYCEANGCKSCSLITP